jgi:hypothetical protein
MGRTLYVFHHLLKFIHVRTPFSRPNDHDVIIIALIDTFPLSCSSGLFLFKGISGKNYDSLLNCNGSFWLV